MKTKTILIITLCCFFASCGVTKNLSKDRLISHEVVSRYAVDRQSDVLKKYNLKSVDTLYYSRDKLLYRKVELKFKFKLGEKNPNILTSYVLYLIGYNNKGKMAKVDGYDIPLRPDGSVENPNHIKHGTGQPFERWVYTYNDDGDMIEVHYYERNNREDLVRSWRRIYSYDKKENVTEEMLYYEGRENAHKKNLTQYDEKGNILSETHYYLTDSIADKILYQYNKQGDIETEEYINSSGKVSSRMRYEYTYNNNRHWREKKEYLNGNPNKISEREFGYYWDNKQVAEFSQDSLIQNELWWITIPAIHHHGMGDGTWALYLYDNGRFVEKRIMSITAKKRTRRGYYTYQPETATVKLTYTDKEGGTTTFAHPSSVNDRLYFKFLPKWPVSKFEKGEKPKYIKLK